MTKPTFIFVDAHFTGLGAMLAQGDDITSAKPVASRTTSQAESQYPQLDLEALSIDFGLRRFRDFAVGPPNKITIVTDHKPLCSVFNGNRQGSIRTERIKDRHQDIRHTVKYQRGSSNQADYLSRHAKPIHMLDASEQSESEDLNNLLYTLHTTSIMDLIGIAAKAKATNNDENLKQLQDIVTKGQTRIPKTVNVAFDVLGVYILYRTPI